MEEKENKNEIVKGLVEIRREEAVTTSVKVAKDFRKMHKNVIQAIDNLLAKNSATQNMFFESTYKANDNQYHRMYYMTMNGFSLLVMGFTGKKALEWKIKYINAFNQMFNVLAYRNTPIWISERETGKLARRSETDIIKDYLIPYARSQGSQNYEKLYITYTRLANQTVGITNRDVANTIQLRNLAIVENIIENIIKIGIKGDLYYKDIYQQCKKRLKQFKEIAFLT